MRVIFMEISLAGKVAIVTGAASGIGLAVVKTYLDCGAMGIVAVDRKRELPKELSDALATHKDKLIFVHGDVSEEQAAIDSTLAALDNFGRIDIFVSNAAISIVKPLHLHSPEEWDAVMNVNVKSLYWAARHVIPVMMEQKRGLILITGSISGVSGIATQGAYAP
jgi:dihydroanticapsin dehydrogenase